MSALLYNIEEVNDMADYEKMYYKLFNKITDIIKELEDVQKETEEMYISFGENEDDNK